MDLLFTLGTLAQLGARPKEMENTLKMPKDVLLLGTTLEGKQGRPNQVGDPIHVKFESISGSRAVCSKTDA